MWSIEPETKPGTLTQKEKQNIAKKMIKQTKLIQLFFAVERITQKTIMNTRNRQWYAMKYSKKHDSPLYEHFKTQDFETVFTSGYRRLAMNLDDPRISEGLTISLKALSKMKQKTESCQIDFLVVLISTKEMVFSNYYKDDRIELSDSMHWLSEQEYVIRSRVQEYLKQQGISYIDTLPALTQCLQQRHQPYFVDADGHLNAVGQRTVAESVHDVLKAADQR